MIPVSLLLAMIVAFGAGPSDSGTFLPDVGYRIIETVGGVILVAMLSVGLGYWVSAGVSSGGGASRRVRSRYTLASRLLVGVAIGIYAWIIHSVGWSRIVNDNGGLEGAVLLDDLVILLPYIAMQYSLWYGQYVAESALRIRLTIDDARPLARFLWLKSRQSFGLILPVLLAYVVRGDLLDRFWPNWDSQPWASFLEVASLGSVVVVAAPLFVRIAWPMTPLPDGPLRRHLEQAASRAGFPFADILVWDTGRSMVNACVSGVIPRFRYVMITDLLLDTLTPQQTAAVFGHEIGHVVHRHQWFLAFFFVGSLSVLALASHALTFVSQLVFGQPSVAAWGVTVPLEFAEATVLLLLVAVYFWSVFGGLSRRFERQADIYGTKIISCDDPDCFIHYDDFNEQTIGDRREPTTPTHVCPGGIRAFTSALAHVADSNGIEPTRYSFRHGSIASRIAFIQSLDQDSIRERQFQRSVRGNKLILGLVFIVAFALEFLWMNNGS